MDELKFLSSLMHLWFRIYLIEVMQEGCNIIHNISKTYSYTIANAAIWLATLLATLLANYSSTDIE